MRPFSIPSYIKEYAILQRGNESIYPEIKMAYKRLTKDSATPLVSIVVPAYNEEEDIVPTLASLCNNVTTFPVEIIVVNNNSVDETGALALKCGVSCLLETKKGVKNARTTGLHQAKGKIIINADADTLYPIHWIQKMAEPLLNNENIACAYGKFAFMPQPGYTRLNFYIYELIGDIFKFINGSMKDKAMYVYGCASAFRKQQALSVDGYNHPPGTNEDGYLGLKLRNKFGKLYAVTNKNAFAWTSSRKFVADKSLTQRIKRKTRELIKNNDID